MRPVYILYLLPLFLLSCAKPDTIKALQQLDTYLEQKADYESQFLSRIDTLRELLQDNQEPSGQYIINANLAREFETYSLDSSLFYYSANRAIAEQINDSYKLIETNISLAKLYAMAGYLVESQDILDRIDINKVPSELKYSYYDCYHSLMGEMMAYTSSDASYTEKATLRDNYRRMLLTKVQEGSYEQYFLLFEEAQSNGNALEAESYARLMINETKQNSHDYAKACFFYHLALKDNGKQEQSLQWLVNSAIADVVCATKDYASLNTLAQDLFDRGEIEKAFNYAADHCLPDAIAYNGKLRPWQIAQFFPKLELAYQQLNKDQIQRLTLYFGLISVLLVALVILLSIIIRRNKLLISAREDLNIAYKQIEGRNQELTLINEKLSQLNSRIDEADKVKQEYIALFLSMLSENISTTRSYKNHILKALRRGAERDIINEIENLPPIEDDIESFYKMFDETFINLYPDFVDKFNSLLAPNEAIYPKANDILSPELRIFALIKLGICDSSKIASLLHYSANTIYNYRAKIKNKSRLDRNAFEDAVKNI